jgi:uncharacterized protein YraI
MSDDQIRAENEKVLQRLMQEESSAGQSAPIPKMSDDQIRAENEKVLQRGAMIYEVVSIPNGDYLNVRSGAGSTYPIIGRLAPGTGGISSTAAAVKNGDTAWLRISVGNLSGWVNSDFLKPAGGKGASPPQTNQESNAQNQASATPQVSESEQRASYWAGQGYHFDPRTMTAYAMDRKVEDIVLPPKKRTPDSRFSLVCY